MSRRPVRPLRQSARKQEPGTSPEVRSLLTDAIREHQAGRLEEAKQLYLRVLAIDAKHGKALYGLGLILHQLGSYEAAVRMMQRAITVNPREAAYHSSLAAVFQAQRKPDEAIAEYRQVLALKPDDEEAHFLLGNALLGQGMSEAGQGKLEEAKAHYERALALNSEVADTHNNLGLACLKLGRPDEARVHYERALTLNPDFVEAYNNLGNLLREESRFEEAAMHYEQALTLKPDYAEAHNNLALVLQHEGKLDEARLRYERALAINPQVAETHNNLGTILREQGELLDAGRHYEIAIALKPDHAETHNNLGVVLQGLGRLEEAVAAHQRAVELKHDFAEAYNNLGVVLRDIGRLDSSSAAHERALELKPDYPEALNNLGVVRRDQSRPEESEACYERALALRPDYADAYSNLGNTLKLQGRLKEARSSYQRAMSFETKSEYARWNLCLVDLLEGNYADGWRDYEVRHHQKQKRPRSFPEPMWQGEPLNGARILLHAEQGLGDTLQFLRFVPMIQAAGGKVLLDVPLALQRLAAELPGLAALTVTGEPLAPFDWHSPLMSLPLAFGVRVESIPAQVPYLTVPADAKNAADKLEWLGDGLRVGVVWSGNPKYSEDQFRSIPWPLVETLLEVKEVRFFSLQLGAAASRLTTSRTTVTDLQTAIGDMADTSALIEHLDLIITVDTAVAHLAGALAKPTWVLLPFVPDWRWLLDREDSPWYPTARLFRQPRLGDWNAVIEQVRSELGELAKR